MGEIHVECKQEYINLTIGNVIFSDIIQGVIINNHSNEFRISVMFQVRVLVFFSYILMISALLS